MNESAALFRSEPKLLLTEKWKNASLEADRCIDEGINQNEKRRLLPVFAKPKSGRSD
ncbi:MAG: hypothetical protein ACSLFK_14455 [Gemmatimonadaceae bacterium]